MPLCSVTKDSTTTLQAYYRRASANMALGKFKLALRDFEAVSVSFTTTYNSSCHIVYPHILICKMANINVLLFQNNKHLLRPGHSFDGLY